MIARSARALRPAGTLGLALLIAIASRTAAAAPLDRGPATAMRVVAAQSTDVASPDGVTIPDYQGYVTDLAGVLDDATRAKLESFLDQVQKKTTVQFAVLTVRTTAPLDPSDYKVRVFKRWKIGDAEKDNGLLMLVAVDDHAVRFETGYGLEGTLPDGLQSRIFRNDMAPLMRAGDMAGGITQGVLKCAAKIAAEQGVTLEWDGSELRYDEPSESRGGNHSLLIALIVFIILSIVMRSIGGGLRGGFGGWGGLGGLGGGFGGFGGGWGGGGGFGGGSSGGGGGGSFGGFGGGSSGGGGGGGNW